MFYYDVISNGVLIMNIQEPDPSMQKIQEVNAALDKVIKSQKNINGHVYLVINSKTGKIETTNDKAQASSMREVLIMLDELTKTSLTNADIKSNRQAIYELRPKFDTFMKTYENKERKFFPKILYKIVSFVRGIFQLKEQIQENIDNRLAIYGYKNKGEKNEKSMGYAKYAERELYKRKMQEGSVNQFDKIKDSSDLDILAISKAFDEELYKEFSPRWAKEQGAVEFVSGTFGDVLTELTDQVESEQFSAEEAKAQFFSLLKGRLLQKNRETLELDRETFKDLVGSRVKDGKGVKVPKDMDVKSEEVLKLITDYNTGVWQEGEKTLTKDIMDEEMFAKMNQALSKILDTGIFKTVLNNYFSQVVNG